jgi:hypothetical protein
MLLPRADVGWTRPALVSFSVFDDARSPLGGIVVDEAGPAANNLGRSAEYCRRSDPRDEATH